MGAGQQDLMQLGGGQGGGAQPQPNQMVPQQIAAGAAATAMVLASHQRAMQQGRDLVVLEQELVSDFQSWDEADKGVYNLRFGKTEVRGLSVRAAEQVQYRMGHLRSEPTMVAIGNGDVQVNVAMCDLVKNNTVAFTSVVNGTIERKYQMDDRVLQGTRKNSKGETLYIYPANEGEMTRDLAKAQAVLWRNCVMKITPPHVRKAIFDTLKLAELGQFTKSRPKAIAEIVKTGSELRPSVSAKEIALFLGHQCDEMTSEEFVDLRSMFKAIEDKAVTWKEIMEQKAAREGKGADLGLEDTAPSEDAKAAPPPQQQQRTATAGK